MSIVAPASKALTSNPKDLFGAVKISLSKLPAVAVAHGAHAMMDGAEKYGAYNWRDKKVIASIYVDAAKRHLDAFFEGEECAADSEAHHLGHAIACCAILLDAQETGNLIDDRPNGGGIISRVYDRLSAIVKRRAAAKSASDTYSILAEAMKPVATTERLVTDEMPDIVCIEMHGFKVGDRVATQGDEKSPNHKGTIQFIRDDKFAVLWDGLPGTGLFVNWTADELVHAS